jgi:uncharacterized protein (TIGR02246 family)
MRKMLPVVMILFCTAAVAEEPNAAVHNALRQLKTTMEKALNERDLNTIVANVTPDVVFTTMNGDVCKGRDQIRAYFNRMMNDPGHVVKSITTSFDADALTTLYGDNTGVAYGSSNDHYELVNGQKFAIHGRWTCTMVRQGDKWLIASFHYSANIFDNPVLNKMRSVLLCGGAIAVVIALILGVIVGRATKKAA